jgi:2-C-methyl-D-erythritol 2,4-cyclodiphosphate synthase
MRIGHGYDVHRLVQGRPLILGGVTVPYEKGLLGHSDADVLLHAVMDAILGALCLGDIGHLFPDSDPAYEGADSMRLTAQVADRMALAGYRIGNVDVTVIAQAPKLAPFISTMRANVASVLHTEINRISIKATTEERLGFTGSGEGIAAHAVCLLEEV